jgi:hypothetical protein
MARTSGSVRNPFRISGGLGTVGGLSIHLQMIRSIRYLTCARGAKVPFVKAHVVDTMTQWFQMSTDLIAPDHVP